MPEKENLPAELKNNLPAEQPKQEGFSPETLFLKAIEHNVPVETMERLMAMRKELKEEKAKEDFFKALSEFQSACPIIQKKKQVFGKDGKLRYVYAPLDDIVQQVKEPLKNHGFSYTIKTEQDDKSVTAICRLHHIAGHTSESSFRVPIDRDAYMTSQQKEGSALSFAKRYAFLDATGILTGDMDDDANGVEKEPQAGQNRQNKPTPNQQSRPVQPQKPAQQKPPAKPIQPAQSPEWQQTYSTANEILTGFISDSLLSREDISATIALVLQKKGQLKDCTIPQIEDVVTRCQKVADFKLAEKAETEQANSPKTAEIPPSGGQNV